MGAYHMPSFLIFSKSLLFFLVAGMLLGAAYMLWLYQRVFFGEVTNPHLEEHVKGKDMNGREWGYMMPLVLLALWIGLYPKPVFDKMDRSVQYLMGRMRPAIERVAAAKGAEVPRVKAPEAPAEAAAPAEGAPVSGEGEAAPSAHGAH
jgi:NADH-quinone oxidoreductase subunit M